MLLFATGRGTTAPGRFVKSADGLTVHDALLTRGTALVTFSPMQAAPIIVDTIDVR